MLRDRLFVVKPWKKADGSVRSQQVFTSSLECVVLYTLAPYRGIQGKGFMPSALEPFTIELKTNRRGRLLPEAYRYVRRCGLRNNRAVPGSGFAAGDRGDSCQNNRERR